MQTRHLIPVLAAFLALGSSSGQARQAPLQAPIAAGFSGIPVPAAQGAAQPNLTTDKRGRVWLSWLEPKPGGFKFRVAQLEGARWSTPITIAEGANLLANWADFPSIFAASDGSIAAHWLERGEPRGSYGIRVSTSKDDGRTWSKPVNPHAERSAGEHGFVSMFDAPGGGVGMIWLDGSEMSGMALRSTVVKNAAAGEDVVVDPRVCQCCQTSAARTDDAVLVAYRDRSDREIRDTSVVRFSGGKWSAPISVHADGWELTGCPVNGPAIAASGNSAGVAWFTAAGGTPKTLAAFSGDGGRTFSAPIQVVAGTALGRLAVVMLSPDRLLVSSLDRPANGARLVLREVRRDGRVSPGVEISEATSERTGGFARLTRSGSKLVVAWTEVRPGAPSAVRTAIGEIR